MRKEYDFSNSKRAKDVLHLSKLQNDGKTRITIMLDNDVLTTFKKKAQAEGIGYQTLIYAALREACNSKPVDEESLRRIIHDELKAS
jgi:uncharacterized protein (DUF4415 family)